LKCSAGDSNIIEIVEKGVKNGKIMIPGAENISDKAAFKHFYIFLDMLLN